VLPSRLPSDTIHEITRPRSLSIVLLSLGSLLSLGCSRGAQTNAPAASKEITVAAASNLTDAFTEMGKEFTFREGVRVVFSFGSSADLARQIENGAPFDVFASADTEHIGKLKREGLVIPGTDKLFARGRLVLWIPPGSRLMLDRIEDITRADIERIAIAKPDVAPYGRATVEALRALNLWAQVEPKVVYGQNVSQTKQYAATGNVEVAFVPRSLVKAGEGRMIEVDAGLHQPINQALAVIGDSRQPEAAQRFVAYVLSPEGKAVLERYGYEN